LPKVVDPTGWSEEQMKPYLEPFKAAVAKLVAQFPDDISAQGLFEKVQRGERRVWLVLDDDDSFMAFAMTTTRILDATGVKTALLCDLAGERIFEAADELCEALENWADEIRAECRDVEGRPGWSREMKKRGYEPYAMLWRKKVKLDG
jgi:hypothetical protein